MMSDSDARLMECRARPQTIMALIESRRAWIRDVLEPWCRTATRKELQIAEAEWVDLAGRAAPEQTLWHWAWSRFPALARDGLTGINETMPVRVIANDGRLWEGYPDARASTHGRLVLVLSSGKSSDPLSIDEIQQIEQLPP